ncbi:MAG: radical SAM protein [Candidatus Saccharimonadales bacterium]
MTQQEKPLAESLTMENVVMITEEKQIPPLFVVTGPEPGKGPDSGCNMTCSYCTPFGEGRSGGQQRLSSVQLLDVLGDAYAVGIRTFRFTGGEPTLDPKLGDKMLATQNLGEDVQIALTTNGARLRRLFPVLEKLRNPRVFLSIDAVDNIEEPTTAQGFSIQKVLSPRLRQTIAERPENVDLRLNYVLTQSNKDQLPKLIEYAVEEGISVKIFELLRRGFAFVGNQDPGKVFKNQYVSVKDVLPEFLAELGETRTFAGTGGRGIPMSSFRIKNSDIVFFDSNVGAHYGDVCDGCSHYPCQEGLYGLTLEHGTLFPSGCINESIYRELGGASQSERLSAFKELIAMVGNATLRNIVPDWLPN